MEKILIKIKNRWNAEETRIGKILVYVTPFVLGTIAFSVEFLNLFTLLPENYIPNWDIKGWVGFLVGLGAFIGKFTKKKEEENSSNNL